MRTLNEIKAIGLKLHRKTRQLRTNQYVHMDGKWVRQPMPLECQLHELITARDHAEILAAQLNERIQQTQRDLVKVRGY